ncbi:predicted protein [Plenodomus lingam JN3]|uniref:Predicted protein n=1 Tax=Leptosphaeria maculans (strain JN3 / isolate v23.1.3 / race Av1-4-5-6-7-8) TaxID=985895 RepID=E5ABS8_LEPMJ|nr:predicted protein [Plenodomus lingam JN3]CBY01119.1 predicted protein [Plenodomus lingam JN3]
MCVLCVLPARMCSVCASVVRPHPPSADDHQPATACYSTKTCRRQDRVQTRGVKHSAPSRIREHQAYLRSSALGERGERRDACPLWALQLARPMIHPKPRSLTARSAGCPRYALVPSALSPSWPSPHLASAMSFRISGLLWPRRALSKAS